MPPFDAISQAAPSLMAAIASARERWQGLSRKKSATLILGVLTTLLVVHTFFTFSVRHDDGHHIVPISSYSDTGTVLRRDSWRKTSDFDLVVAHYDENVDTMRKTVEAVLERLPSSSTRRVIIYHKGGRSRDELRELLEIADEVMTIPNVGREGETYLTHITRHWQNARTGLAEKTIFMQPHLAWDWVFLPRMEHHLAEDTGFLSFGPYINQTCGHDSAGMDFPRMRDIYIMFRGTFCPPTSALATWAGQFIVSKKRILQNDLHVYENLRSFFHAPPEHWIWKEGWGNNQLTNPTLGHALERTWPVIFDCADGTIVETCKEKESGTNCQCRD